MVNSDSQSIRDVRLLLVAMGLSSLPFGYTLVVLPIYLKEIGFLEDAIGAVMAASAFANTVALIPFALAADKYGRKTFAALGVLSAILAYVLFAFMRDLKSLLLASAIGGVGLAGGFSAALWTPAWTALLAEKSSPEKRTKIFAWAQGVWTIALTTGSAMSVLPALFRMKFGVTFQGSFQFTFLILAGFALLSGLVLLSVPETKQGSHDSEKGSSESFFRLKSLRQITKFSVTFGMVGLASGFSVQLLSLWFNRMYNVNEAVLGPWFAAAEITSLVVVPVIPMLTRTLGSPKSVLTTQGVSAVLLASMILSSSYEAAGLLFIVRNFFMNISWPIQQSYLMGTVTPGERASASAITSTIWGAGSSVGPLIAGYLLGANDFFLISAPLLIGSAVYLGSAVGFFFFFRNIPPPEEATP